MRGLSDAEGNRLHDAVYILMRFGYNSLQPFNGGTTIPVP